MRLTHSGAKSPEMATCKVQRLSLIHISLYINLMRRPYDPGTRVTPDGRLLMQGRATDGGIEYDCMVEARAEGGHVERVGDCLHVVGADAVTVYVASDLSLIHI